MGASLSRFLSGAAGSSVTDIYTHETRTLSISEQPGERGIDSESDSSILDLSNQFSYSNTSPSTNEHGYVRRKYPFPPRASVVPDVALLAIYNSEYFRLVDKIKYFLAVSTFYGDPRSAFTDEILESLLQPRAVMITPNQKYINLQYLSSLLLDPDVFSVVRYLKQLAYALGLDELSDMHLEPYLSTPFRPIKLRYDIKLPLATGIYKARSFFGAAHAIISLSLPRNRGLGEYLQIHLILARLFNRFFTYVRNFKDDTLQSKYPAGFISNAMNLLVCIAPTANCPYSIATIGFSLSGRCPQKNKLRKDRKENLALLSNVGREGEIWQVGNCGESETYAHMEHFMEVISSEAWEGLDEAVTESTPIFLSMTLKFGLTVNDSAPSAACGQCRDLAKALEKHYSTSIIDLFGSA